MLDPVVAFSESSLQDASHRSLSYKRKFVTLLSLLVGTSVAVILISVPHLVVIVQNPMVSLVSVLPCSLENLSRHGPSMVENMGESDPSLSLGPEDDEGCHEYKRHLVDPSPARMEHLVTQLQWRLSEGNGEALYELGVADNGTLVGLSDDNMTKSFKTLENMAKQLNAEVSIACERRATQGITRTVLVRYRKLQHVGCLEVRITIVGNVDSGKSSLLGVLTSGVLDNGYGLARQSVFRYKHEVESGRTSAISHQIMGFAADGTVVNYARHAVRESDAPDWSDIVTSSSKVVCFFDLAGHEKYFRTTLYGLTGHLPDYAMLVIDPNRGGLVGMTREHLSVLLALKVPFFVTINKVDVTPEHLLKLTVDSVMQWLRGPGVSKLPVLMRNEADVLIACRSIADGTFTPIFLTSSVSGASLDLLRIFLNYLPAKWGFEKRGMGALVHVDSVFQVTGIGPVVSGIVQSGKVNVNQNMLLGPDSTGSFKEVTIQSVMNKCVNVQRAEAGQTATFAIKDKKNTVRKKDFRKGMVLADKKLSPVATWQFQAEILILAHPTALKVGYTPIVHCVTMRQAACIISMNKQELRAGDRATVIFQWTRRPEFMRASFRIVFRERRTRGIGMVTKVMPEEPFQPRKGKRARQAMKTLSSEEKHVASLEYQVLEP